METPQIEMGGFKVNSPQVPNGGLQPTVASSWKSRGTVERALKSIRIVVFTSKLNLLMPFGPASIILHFTTRRHVSADHGI
jgi:Ca2+:H+ antiporter